MTIHGTTTLFADSIDITSVAGYRGFSEFQKIAKYARIFHTIPGGLPVDPKFSCGSKVSQEKCISVMQYKRAFCKKFLPYKAGKCLLPYT